MFYEQGRLGNKLKGIFIIGNLFIEKGKKGLFRFCCLASCCLSKSSFALLYRVKESCEVGTTTVKGSFLSGDSGFDSSDKVLLCFTSLEAASRSWSMKGALRFCGNTFSLSLNPFANGLLSIFNCVI